MTDVTTVDPVPATQSRSWQAWTFLIILALVWGSSFILIKRSLAIFSSEQVAAGRIMLAWFFFIPMLAHQSRQSEIRATVRQRWIYLLFAGLLGNLIPAFLFSIAGAHLNSSLSGALNSLSPLFTLLLGALFFGRSIKIRQLTGILLGLAGSILLIFFSTTGSFTINGYALLIVLATICYGININLVGRYLSNMPSLVSTSWIFMMVGPIALLWLLPTDMLTRIGLPGAGSSMIALMVLGILGSGVMTILFNRVVQLTTPVFASSVTYLIPIVALGWGIADGESVYLAQYTGMGICLLGIYLTNK